MQANRISVMAAVVIATAVASFTATTSQAQTPATQVRQGPVRAAIVARPPARVTVRKRSYLDPGTETKRRAEHYTDYAYPNIEYGNAPFRHSTLFKNGPSLPFIHDRMPFPTCLDLPGFCQ
jgi:hypothetical protein